jgi:hypothetical protein
MKKSQVIVLIVSLGVSVGILVGLYALSPLSKPVYRASFERKFMDGYVRGMGAVMDLEFNSFYVAGYSGREVYLGNVTAPFHLVKVNHALTDSVHVMLGVRLDSVVDFRRFKVSVVPPYFYLAHGVEPVILRGDTSAWQAVPVMRDSGYFFVEAVAMGPKTFALRSYSSASKSYELGRKTPGGFVFHDALLEKQLDGLFCVDGKLFYNRQLSKLVYLYFYRNEFFVADSLFALNYRGHTIDTFSRVRLKVATIDGGRRSMTAAPPMVVNGLSCTDGAFLFVQSALLAKNEDEATFMGGATVDCYRLTDGKYMGSFHLPKYGGENLSGFQVAGERLFAVFGKYLVSFSLNTSLLDEPGW